MPAVCLSCGIPHKRHRSSIEQAEAQRAIETHRLVHIESQQCYSADAFNRLKLVVRTEQPYRNWTLGGGHCAIDVTICAYVLWAGAVHCGAPFRISVGETAWSLR